MISESVSCQYCGFNNPNGTRFCLKCGYKLTQPDLVGSRYYESMNKFDTSQNNVYTPEHKPPLSYDNNKKYKSFEPYGSAQHSPYPHLSHTQSTSQVQQPPILPIVNPGTSKIRWLPIIMGLCASFLGIMFSYLGYSLFGIDIIYGLFIPYLMIVIPLVGVILSALKYYRISAILFLINSIILILMFGIMTIVVGCICLVAGSAAMEIVNLEKKYSNYLELLPNNIAKLFKKPAKKIKVIAIIGIIILMVIPGVYFAYIINNPKVEIEYVNINAPNNMPNIKVFIRLKNKGGYVVAGENIKIELVFQSKTLKLDWPSYYDIEPQSAFANEFEIEKISGEYIKEVIVYYLNIKSDTYSI